MMMMVVAHRSGAASPGQRSDNDALYTMIEGSDCEIHHWSQFRHCCMNVGTAIGRNL